MNHIALEELKQMTPGCTWANETDTALIREIIFKIIHSQMQDALDQASKEKIKVTDVLDLCVDKQACELLKFLVPFPELQFSEHLYWPMRYAVLRGKTQAIETLFSFVPNEKLEDLANHFLNFHKNQVKNRDFVFEGFEFFALHFPLEIKQKFIEMLGVENAPLLGKSILSQNVSNQITHQNSFIKKYL